MTTWSGNQDGSVSEEEVAYYAHRSTGVGLVITATTYAEPRGKGFSGQFYAGSDAMIPSLRQLSNSIHAGGAKAILQVFHAGRKANPKDMPEGYSVSASNIPGKREDNNIPVAMDHQMIQRTIKSFADVMKRAITAGFDGIEIHGANTYLLQQFFSPHSNRRSDEWGGSLDNRVRLPLAVIEACMEVRREMDKPNFIIGYRFSPEENSDPGISLEDTDYLIDQLCTTDLDYLHVSLGNYQETSMRDETIREATLDRIIKKINGRKPFIGVGSVYTLDAAEDMLNKGVDFVALGRQLLVDAKSVDKWSKGLESFEAYDPKKKTEEKMPTVLEQVILDNRGWVPIVD
jgi:2,4-dienoyl-CoA reductase-like NADH-dependent reductase (Old Yellow Enzyme family)